MTARALAAALACAIAGASCAPALRRYPLAQALWRDDDTRAVPRTVRAYESADAHDFLEQSLFRPAASTLSVELPREAVNVNALDEVPDSSWFTNRLLRGEVTPDVVARGACSADPPDGLPGEWTVTSAKANGYNPGFVATGPDGRRYVLKADGARQPELASAADAIGARIYHALGYHAPCNRVVALDASRVRIAPEAAAPSRGRRRVTSETLARVFAAATRLPDGRYRMSASLFLEGDALGPFTYQGVREDDPNDVVPHEDRRELRGARLVAAWIGHVDAREANTMTTWIDGGDGRGHVRHWMLDFGDCFGTLLQVDDLSRRSGHAFWLDPVQIGVDLVALGAVSRPWHTAAIDPRAPVFGYFRADDFDPAAWRGIEPNPAFQRMTERDAAWMARLLARLDAPRVRAAVAAGAFARDATREHLARVLMERRRRILARYLTRLSPLADASLEGDALCATDLAAREAVLPGGRYRAVRYAGARLDRRASLAVTAGPGERVCVAMGAHVAGDGGPRDDDPARYVVVDVTGAAAGRAPLRVHLYDLGPRRGWRLVGLERPEGDAAPGA